MGVHNVDQELQRQYSPSVWCKRFPANEVVSKHVHFVTEVSDIVKSTVPYEANIAYGNKITETMDIFGGTNLPRDSPVFVYIHGGYWQELNKTISSYCVEPLFRNGIRVIVPDYDLAPEVTLDEIVAQIKSAATNIMKMAVSWGVRSVWFGGHSAGAHLAASLLDEKWLSNLEPTSKEIFCGLVLISGIYDLRPLVFTDINDALNLNESSAIAQSPMLVKNENTLAVKNDFKIFIAVAENDSPEFIKQSEQYHKVILKDGIKSELCIVPEVDHFNIVENLNKENYPLTQNIIALINSL